MSRSQIAPVTIPVPVQLPVPVTVITTIAGGEHFRARYFDNLRRILRPVDHAVIVDDGSENPVILPPDLAGRGNIALITSPKIGRGAALDLAISHAPDDLLAILDIDDLAHPDRLAIQSEFLRDHRDVLAFGRALTSESDPKHAHEDEDGLPPAPARPDWHAIAPARLYRGNPLHHSSLMFDRAIWQRIGGYDANLGCCIDLDFYLRACAHGGARMWLCDAVLIWRNLARDNRYFAQIPDATYRRTRRDVLARHRRDLAVAAPMTLFDHPLCCAARDIWHAVKRRRAKSPAGQAAAQAAAIAPPPAPAPVPVPAPVPTDVPFRHALHRPDILAIVQLPPPLHGAAVMNAMAIDAMAEIANVTTLRMEFARSIGDVARFRWAKIAGALALLGQIWRKLRNRPDAFYICFAPAGAAFYRDSLYVICARIWGIPAILHLHGRGLATARRHLIPRLIQWAVFARQTVIILGSDLAGETAGLGCDTRIIANALPDPAFAPPADTIPHGHNAPSRPAGPRLLFLSNLFYEKGIDDVIAACALLHRRGQAFRLAIAGAPGDLGGDELAAMIDAAGIAGLCHYHGPVDAPMRRILMADADLFVFPSRYRAEAQPLVVLEAMAAGLPVISTAIGTLGSIISDGKTGRICPPRNPDALAEIITDCLARPDHCRDMAKAARIFCEAAFGQKRFEHDMQHLVRHVAQSRAAENPFSPDGPTASDS